MNKIIIKHNFLDKINDNNYKNTIQYFYYFYIIIVPKNINLSIESNKNIIYSFILKKKYNLHCFYIYKSLSFINITSDIKNKSDLKLYRFVIKNEDSYVFGKEKIFKNIKEVINQQYIDYIKTKNKSISTVLFMKLTSNKLIYHQYFIDIGYMTNTKIERNYSNKNNYYKAPYSSASYCASKKKLSDRCYVNDGIIIQKSNDLLKKIELKCIVINGKIISINLKINRGKNSGCYSIGLDKTSLKKIPDDINKLIHRYIDDIKIFVKNTFIETNILVNIYNYVKKIELNYINKDKYLKQNKELFFSDLTYTKISKLNEHDNKYKDYIDFLNKPLSSYRSKFKNNYKIIEEFMRIDIMLPDEKYYKDLSIIEIEPFASGHGFIDNNKICMGIPDNTILLENTSPALVLLYLIDDMDINKLENIKNFKLIFD